MLSTNFRDSIMNIMDGSTYTAFTPYCGLITAISSFRTPSVTEANYTGYGTRPSISFGAPADTSPAGGRQKANDALVTFPQNTGSSQDVIAWGIWNVSTGGTQSTALVWIGMLDADPAVYAVCDDTTADTLLAPAHGLSNNQRVFVQGAPGALIPTGLSEGTAYFVGTSTADNVTLSTTTANGNPVAITAKGACMLLPYTAVTIAAGATPEFAIGALVIQL